ncbi:MAG TPA: histidine kinase dimerization/phospho-acceptor domain-containing protein, partial [Thermodesulfobacteriota bacterium]|nr:histidine kinase dimerization/phospho-acceptor domain-containing protein [Thermodesulfobacteriota bacterium]
MRKVLVVDPSSPERNSIRQMLKDDYVVLTSGDWKEGTRIAAQERVDFALIGTDLPLSSDLPHFRALEKIRPPVSVILLVDEKAWGDRVHFLSMEWLPKPVRPESLREKLKALTPVRDWYDKGMDSFPPPAGAPQAWDREIFVEAVISILAHEIKNPLVTINTFSSLLPEKYSDPEFRNDFSRLAALEVNRINTVLERLFEYSDLFYPAAAPMDLNSAVREFLEKEATNLSRREVRVATHLDARLPAVNFDGEHLDFVLRRIMEHMLATPSNGKCLRVATSLGAE